jgi:hypothetical protein
VAKCSTSMFMAILSECGGVNFPNSASFIWWKITNRTIFWCGYGILHNDNHAFWYPVFALQNKLAAGISLPKWSRRSFLGLNFCPSPNDAWTVNIDHLPWYRIKKWPC